MKRSLSLVLIAAVFGVSAMLVAVSRDRSGSQTFLLVGHRYKCIVEGTDFEVTVREIIDHQWIRAEMEGQTVRTPEGDRRFPVLINLSRVNAIVPVDVAEVRASLRPAVD